MGTSGWQYPHWRGVFYPAKLPQRRWLPYLAERFQTVEVNNTFYNLPEKSVFEQWRAATPADFVFTLKMSRYLTHLKRLHDPAGPVQLFLERASGLGDKRGPILLQLPPRLRADVALLDAALALFEPSIRVAVEFRDDSWFTDDTRAVLERHRAALCLADSRAAGSPPGARRSGASSVSTKAPARALRATTAPRFAGGSNASPRPSHRMRTSMRTSTTTRSATRSRMR